MVSLEQVKLLETKVSRAIEYIKKATEEKGQLKEKLDSYQKRIDELELLVQRFREDQSRIEDSILSTLDRLNQFEDALESKLPTEPSRSSAEKKGEGEPGAVPATRPPQDANEANSHPISTKKENLVKKPSGPEARETPSGEKNPQPAEEGGELDIF